MRHTEKALTELFESTREYAIAAGVTEAERWQFDVGNRTYSGVSIWLAHPDYRNAMASKDRSAFAEGWSAHYSPCVASDLGDTLSEAYRSLRFMRTAFIAVINSRKDVA